MSGLTRHELDQLFRHCLALTGHREDAQDLLQAGLKRYLANAPAEATHPVGYLRRILRNLHIDQLRRMGVVTFETLPDEDGLGGVEADLEKVVVDAVTLDEAWSELSFLEREALLLWAVEGLSASEIALQLGEPRGTILSRLHRLRVRMAVWRSLRDGGGGDV